MTVLRRRQTLCAWLSGNTSFFPACDWSICFYSRVLFTWCQRNTASSRRELNRIVCASMWTTLSAMVKRHAKTQWKVIPLETNPHRGRDLHWKHKHNIGTDLEAPVVWLLLGASKKQRAKETEKGQGREKEGKKDSVRHFVMLSSCKTAPKKKQTKQTEPEQKNWNWSNHQMWFKVFIILMQKV